MINILVYLTVMNGCSYHRLLLPYRKLAVTYPDVFNIQFIGNKNTTTEIVANLHNYDYFVFQRVIDKDLFDEVNKHITTIMDLDDYWFLPNGHLLSNAFIETGFADKCKYLLKNSDYVTTSTNLLANVIMPYNSNVFVFENALERFGQYNSKPTDNQRIRFGIVGSSSHTTDMVLLNHITKYIPDNIKDKMQIVLAGFCGSKTHHFNEKNEVIKVDKTPWKDVCWAQWESNFTNDYTLISDAHKKWLKEYNEGVDDPFTNEFYRRLWCRDVDKYATLFDNIDVLLVPLKDCCFNQYKSNLKMVEAAVKGKGLIISKVTPYKEYATPFNGLWVPNGKNQKGFAEAMIQMIKNPNMIKQQAECLEMQFVSEGAPFNLSTVTEKRKIWFDGLC